ncbi:very long-chain fatty acid-CoA ligase [Aureococcus anophagefferens]|nr:very long-chain fatty acid-CoA ligase [Aureococcus anophagefferens]
MARLQSYPLPLHGRRVSRAGATKWNVLVEWRRAVAEAPRAIARAEDRASPARLTYAEVDALSDEFAEWIKRTEPGGAGAVALLMGNSCAFLVAWLGVAKAGRAAALVNCTLRGDALAHALGGALGAARATLCVADADLLDVAAAALGGGGRAFAVDGDDAPPPEPWARRLWRRWTAKEAAAGEPGWDDVLAYIYTSGTTGLPKAARITHGRAWSGGTVCASLCRLAPGDRLYSPLPLFHATAGLLGLWGCVRARAALVVRRKFSARLFASDCARCGAAGCLYVGELARFVVDAAGEASPRSDAVALRFAFGNGMPRDGTWRDFERVLHIERVIEFYGSTEGNVNLFNNLGRVGAVGIMPRALMPVYPVFVARLAEVGDEEAAAAPVLRRDADGLCEFCEPGELAEHVKRRGDVYFRSGDLVSFDRLGFLYFADRAGETFRWKGETCSTCEVAAAVLKAAPDVVAECAVYGVKVPGKCLHLGRCGCAAVVLRADAPRDWPARLFSALETAGLPPAALPGFLRRRDALPTTATHERTEHFCIICHSFRMPLLLGAEVPNA